MIDFEVGIQSGKISLEVDNHLVLLARWEAIELMQMLETAVFMTGREKDE